MPIGWMSAKRAQSHVQGVIAAGSDSAEHVQNQAVGRQCCQQTVNDMRSYPWLCIWLVVTTTMGFNQPSPILLSLTRHA